MPMFIIIFKDTCVSMADQLFLALCFSLFLSQGSLSLPPLCLLLYPFLLLLLLLLLLSLLSLELMTDTKYMKLISIKLL